MATTGGSDHEEMFWFYVAVALEVFQTIVLLGLLVVLVNR